MKSTTIVKYTIVLFLFNFLLYIYFPVAVEMVDYTTKKSSPDIKLMSIKDARELISTDPEVYQRMLSDRSTFVPKSETFGIIIPKIRANAVVIAETDFMEKENYVPALQRGVAHAKWSGYPDKSGTTVIFSHIEDSFWRKAHYNTRFLLMYLLQPQDNLWIFYHGKQYTYRVTKIEKVRLSDVRYDSVQSDKKLLSLITAWPPGLSWKSLVLTAEQIE